MRRLQGQGQGRSRAGWSKGRNGKLRGRRKGEDGLALRTGNIDLAGVRSSKIKAREPTDDLPRPPHAGPSNSNNAILPPTPALLARVTVVTSGQTCPPSQKPGNHRRFCNGGVSRKHHRVDPHTGTSMERGSKTIHARLSLSEEYCHLPGMPMAGLIVIYADYLSHIFLIRVRTAALCRVASASNCIYHFLKSAILSR